MNRDQLDFGSGEISRLFRIIFFPTLIGMVSMTLLNICDGMFVGHGVGSDGLAAINIVAPLFLICTGIGLMFGIGASVIGGIRLAEKNTKAARIIMTQAYLAGAVVFALITTVVYLWTDNVLYIFGCSPRLLPLAEDYLMWIMPGLCFLFLQCAGMMLIRLDGSPRYAMAVQIVSAVVNIFLDWLMVFPLGMGIKGASVATSISCIISGSMVVAYFLWFSSNLKFYRLKWSRKSMRLTLRNIGYMSRIGFATLLSEVAMGVMMVAGNFSFMHLLGENGVAAFGVGCYLFPVMFSISNAVAQSAQPIISFNYGIRQPDRISKALRVSLSAAIGCGILIAIMLWIGAPLLTKIFLPAAAPAFAIAAHGLPLLGTCAVCFAVNITFIGYYQSLDRATLPIIYTLLRGMIFVVPGFFLLPLLLGISGLWLAIPTAELLTMLIIIGVFAFHKLKF